MSGEAAFVCLADGTVFEGVAFGAPGVATGEAVFTTGMTGYQEVISDPSYTGQLVAMTAPEIGNTGINDEDHESVSGRPALSGLVVREASAVYSSWRARESLHDHLDRHGVVGVAEIDTRSLTRHLRDHGAQNAAMGAAAPATLLAAARAAPPMTGLDLVQRVTPSAPYAWTESTGVWRAELGAAGEPPGAGGGPFPGKCGGGAHVVVIDLGIKRNILRCLVDTGFRITAVPATFTAEQVLDLSPDGVFVSNGPGDPAAVTYAVDTLRDLLGIRPVFGICLGHQLVALAAGARTYKLRFGHRGLNQPVKDLATGRVEITTQNHGFAVDLASLEGRARSTHVHLDDGTSEGLEIDELDAFSVQFHPEAAAGPHDALYLFERFAARVTASKARYPHDLPSRPR